MVFETGTTGRDARPFLSKYGAKKPDKKSDNVVDPDKFEVYTEPRATGDPQLLNIVDEVKHRSTTPEVAQAQQDLEDDGLSPQHSLALVKIRDVSSIDDETIRGIGLTISQMSLLGMTSVIMLDPLDPSDSSSTSGQKLISEQVDRVVSSIDEHGHVQAMRLENAIEVIRSSKSSSSLDLSSKIRVARSSDILQSAKREIISVLAPVAWNPMTMEMEQVSADDAVLALAHELSGVAPTVKSVQGDVPMSKRSRGSISPLTVDRVIILDPLGDIPSSDPSEGSHIFVNLMQEYDIIQSDLQQRQGKIKLHLLLRRRWKRKTTGPSLAAIRFPPSSKKSSMSEPRPWQRLIPRS